MRTTPSRTTAALATAAAILLVLGTIPNAAPAQAMAKVSCKPDVGMRQVDPITARGSATSAHIHEFFGNKTLLALTAPEDASYDQLVGQPTACTNPGDSALYW